jgi:glyoxylase-like metal-dependent hydrolase (beta-lactamase superfamily II)
MEEVGNLQIIDTKMHGRDGITAAFIVEGDQRALIETGPKSSLEHLLEGLEAAGIDTLDWIVVTHIHLDHAGAAGSLAQRFPGATVAVHEVGAPHLVDPTKLWSSAARIYGDHMDTLWGGIDPVPRERILALQDGDKIDLGGRVLQAIDTPGHARHHHAILDDSTGTVFTGDALGVRLPDIGIMRPATPPPEFNLEAAVGSIERIRSLSPNTLCLTHFGPTHEGIVARGVDDACAAAADALERWAGWVRAARKETSDLDEATALVRRSVEDDLAQSLAPGAVDRLEQTTSYRMNTWGYMRYFDKKASS